MKILLEKADFELTVKGSRFIACAQTAESQAQAREILRLTKKDYCDATHVVHAFVIGQKQEILGSGDDGEPAGTAGRPVLEVLKGSGVTNIIVTVTRYFGGTLLGTGGLVRAYSDATKGLLQVCKTEEMIEKKGFTFESDYATYQTIKRQLAVFHLSEQKEDFDQNIKVSASIWASEYEDLKKTLVNISKGKIRLA